MDIRQALSGAYRAVVGVPVTNTMGDDGASRTLGATDERGSPIPDIGSASKIYRAMSPVFKGVRFRADAIAQIPLELTQDGQPVRPSHPLGMALRLMDQFAQLRDTESDLLIYGRAYWRIRDSAGNLVLAYMPASKVTNPIVDGMSYRYDSEMIPAQNVIHFRGYIPDGQNRWMGTDEVSPVRVILESARLAHFNRGANIVGQRAYSSVARHIVGIVPRAEGISDNQMSILFNWLRGVYYDPDDVDKEKPLAARTNAVVHGRPYVQSVGGRDDPAFEMLQTWFVQEASRALNIPPPMLDDLSRATYNNIKDLRRHWYAGPLTANLRFYESLLRRRLCTPEFNAFGMAITFDTSRVEELQPDRSETSTRVIAEYGANLITQEEAREQLGYDPGVVVESPRAGASDG